MNIMRIETRNTHAHRNTIFVEDAEVIAHALEYVVLLRLITGV